MKTSPYRPRLIESPWFYLVFGILYALIFFGTSYMQGTVPPGGSQMDEYVSRYGKYVPIALGCLSIIVSYMLQIIISMIRLSRWTTKVLIYLAVYGFWLVFGIQLRYFEPRFTSLATTLIDNYSLPLIVASGATLILVLLFACFRKK